MLESSSVETFADRLGEASASGSTMARSSSRSLIQLRPRRRPNDGPRSRAPFSIVFHGPSEPVLPQRIYSFEHRALGTFELFIVPLGPEGPSMQYEAVFG